MSLVDEQYLRICLPPGGKRHIEGDFNQTLCGSWIDEGWKFLDLTSPRYAAKIARSKSNAHCRRCFSQYKDVMI